MCITCYEEYGRPSIITPATRRAASLAKQVYEFSDVGGNLHIVLDDWNLEDESLDFCSRQIADGGSEGRNSPEQLAVERQCCDAFAALSLEERAAALALHYGFLPDRGQPSA